LVGLAAVEFLRAARREGQRAREVCFGSKADPVATNANVRFVPKADMRIR
jgi:hypothetical protein